MAIRGTDEVLLFYFFHIGSTSDFEDKAGWKEFTPFRISVRVAQD